MMRIGLYLVVFFLPFTYWRFPFNIKISEGIALGMIFLFLLSFLTKNRTIYLTPFFIPMMIVISVAILSLIQMPLIPSEVYSKPWARGRYHPHFSGIISVFRYFFLTCFLLLIVNTISNEQVLKKTFKIYLISGTVASLIGISQLVAYYLDITLLSKFTNLSTEGWFDTPLVPQYLGDITLPRIMGPNNEPKMFSNTLVAIIPFTLMAIVQNWSIFKKKTLWLFLTVQMLALLFTFSASGWFAFFIALFIMFIKSGQYRLKYMLMLVLLITFLFPVIFLFDIQMLSMALKFNIDKISHYFVSPANIGQIGPLMAGLEMFKEHPLLGVGIGNFPFHYDTYNILNLPTVDYAALASNEYINILAETGVLGAISWLPFIFVIFKFIKGARPGNLKDKDIFLHSVFVASLTATVASWLQLWATYGIFNPHIWFPLALAVTARRLKHLEKTFRK